MNFIKTYKYYFTCVLIFAIIGGILLLNIEQGDTIAFFSGRRNPAGDYFFKYFTRLGEEYGYILVIAIFLFQRFRFALLAFLAGMGALILSYFLKSYFKHPRPFRYFNELGTFDQFIAIDGVHLLSGALSFPSGHTASGFALYGMVTFLVGKRWYWQLLLFFTALLVGISRIYLIQHFLKDVYLGAFTGIFIAILLYVIQARFPYNRNNWIDKSFGSNKKLPQA